MRRGETPWRADGCLGGSVLKSGAMAPRILVLGCGGIGGLVTAHLARAGHDVTAVSTNRAIAETAARAGITVRGEGPEWCVRATVASAVPGGPFDVVLLATQPTEVLSAAESAKGALAPDGAMVCLQNGLCEERIAPIVGDDRTFGAIVTWGAAMPAPAVVERTAKGRFTVGRLDGALDARVRTLAALLGCVQPTGVTRNLRGTRWSKLALNCAVSTLGTIAGARLGALLQHRGARRLALETMTEAVLVARRAGVRLEKVSGTIDLDWIALTDRERARPRARSLVAKHAVLFAVGLRYRRMRSSMLAAMERGRMPAVDYLNGEVVRHAELFGMRAPRNALLQETVWAIARGEKRAGLPLLEEVIARAETLPLPSAAAPPAETTLRV
jgi:2-dehydropantoate 2-reductase